MGNNKRPDDDSGEEDYNLSPDEQEEVDGRDRRARYWYQDRHSENDAGSIRVRPVISYEGRYSQSSVSRVGLKMS